MTEIGWGHLAHVEIYGRLGDSAEHYKIIKYSDSLENYKSYKKAAHAMIFARDDQILWKLYKAKAAVLMQMRFDGVLGFPGGLVEDDETPLEGINRELEEEINLDLEKYRLCDENHIITFCNDQKKLILHFYAKEVSLDEFKSIEKAVLSADDYGNETLGIVRPPLFVMGDGTRGLPAFLANRFAGNAREELLLSLVKFNIMTQEEIDEMLKAKKNFEALHKNETG